MKSYLRIEHEDLKEEKLHQCLTSGGFFLFFRVIAIKKAVMLNRRSAALAILKFFLKLHYYENDVEIFIKDAGLKPLSKGRGPGLQPVRQKGTLD